MKRKCSAFQGKYKYSLNVWAKRKSALEPITPKQAAVEVWVYHTFMCWQRFRAGRHKVTGKSIILHEVRVDYLAHDKAQWVNIDFLRAMDSAVIQDWKGQVNGGIPADLRSGSKAYRDT